ncbi:hypothetical protein BBI17_004185 [Phytophthora kernoviae]|uniref:DJ-1/PfpI domain-containing protein n=1 Tax=Phytophthora kernoviae TaxID=325452 RepID=A0A3R7J919_9STRA|nr:hypothetical protein BBI17_004185 [Phytophthora kernoviae]
MMAGDSSMYTELEDDEYFSAPVLPHVKPRALIVVADGIDELETLALSDALVRGELHVTISAVGRTKRNIVMGNYGLRIQSQKSIEECSFETYDVIILPGGAGASHVRDSGIVIKMLLEQKLAGRWIAASSSAPAVVLLPHDLLGDRATGASANERGMPRQYVNEDIVVDKRCVTSQGPGTVLKFALILVQLLNGGVAAQKAANELLIPWP